MTTDARAQIGVGRTRDTAAFDRDFPPETRICCVASYALAVPLRRRIADSHAALTHWTIPVVEITTEDGLVGTGIGGIHSGADILCALVDHHFAPELLGRSAVPVRRLWHDLYWSPIQWIGRTGATHLALSLIDIALWDLHAKRAHMPLWQLLGANHPRLSTYNTDGGWLSNSIDELQQHLADCVAAGWSTVKMKVGHPQPQEDVRRMTAAREAVGEDVTLLVDANKMWDLDTATSLLPAMERLGIGWIEEPMHPDDVRAHRELQSRTHIPIALGESLYTRHAFRDFIEAGALRVAQVDVTRVAGITEFLQIATHASEAGIRVVPHAGDMMVVHQHLAAASFAQTPATIEYLPWTLQAYQTPVRIDGTEVVLPSAPGASTEISALARQRWQIPGVGTGPISGPDNGG